MARATLLAAAIAVLVGACTAGDPMVVEPECTPDLPNLVLGLETAASASLDDHPPSLAVDGDPNTAWISGVPPEQWIEVDFGEAAPVTCVGILVHQDEKGTTVHRVNGGAHVDPGRELGTLEGATEDGQWLEIQGDWEFRFLRITTVESPSTVAWFEIVVR